MSNHCTNFYESGGWWAERCTNKRVIFPTRQNELPRVGPYQLSGPHKQIIRLQGGGIQVDGDGRFFRHNIQVVDEPVGIVSHGRHPGGTGHEPAAGGQNGGAVGAKHRVEFGRNTRATEFFQQRIASGGIPNVPGGDEDLAGPGLVEPERREGTTQLADAGDRNGDPIIVGDVTAHEFRIIVGDPFVDAAGQVGDEFQRGVPRGAEGEQGRDGPGAHGFHIGEVLGDGFPPNLGRVRPVTAKMAAFDQGVGGNHGAGVRGGMVEDRRIVTIPGAGGVGDNSGNDCLFTDVGKCGVGVFYDASHKHHPCSLQYHILLGYLGPSFSADYTDLHA